MKKKLPIGRIIAGILGISVILILLGGSYFQSQINSQLVTQSVLERDLIVIETNQTYIDQLLDNVNFCPDVNTNCATATEKFGITIQPVITDSNNRQIPLNATFFNIQKASLTDSEGNLLDLGTFNAGFFAVTNIDDTITVVAEYKVLLNRKELAKNELFASGQTENRHILLKTGDRKTFAYSFADEPESTFKQGVDANLLEIYITKVDAVVGNALDTTKRFLSDKEYPIFRMTLSFDGNKHVIRDYTGTAVSVFKSDNALRSCGYATYVRDQQVQGVNTQVHQYFAIPPKTEVYNNNQKIGETQTPTSFPQGDFGKIGTSCTTLDGLPRESTLEFRVEGKSYQVTTGKTQELHTISCTGTFVNKIFTEVCSSSFGWSK